MKEMIFLENRDTNFLFSVTHESRITYNCFRDKTIMKEFRLKRLIFDCLQKSIICETKNLRTRDSVMLQLVKLNFKLS